MSFFEKPLALVSTIVSTVLVFGGICFWLFTVDANAMDAKKIAESNAEINKKLSVMVISNSSQLKMFLEFSGFDMEVARKWSKIPRKPTIDTLTNSIVKNMPWLVPYEDLQVGVQFKVNDSGQTEVDTLWDIRDKDEN